MPGNVAGVVKDAEYLNSHSGHAIHYSMPIADKAAKFGTPGWFRLAAFRVTCQTAEGLIDIVLIGIGCGKSEMQFSVLADFDEVGTSCMAQDDISHVVRGVQQRFP